MMGTINCCYETPCGWCSRFDKKCERSLICRPKVYHSENDWEHCAFWTMENVWVQKKWIHAKKKNANTSS